MTRQETPAAALAVKIRTNLQPVVDAGYQLTIKSPEDYAKAGELLAQVKKYTKQFKAEKTAVLKPIKDLVKAYEEVLKPTADDLSNIEGNLKQKMLSWNEEQSKKAAEEAAKLEKKIESGYIKNPETISRNMASIETVNNAEAGVTESLVTKVRLVDITKVPAEYFTRPRVLEALMVELRKDVLGNKAQGIAPKEVPGTETYQEKQLSM